MSTLHVEVVSAEGQIYSGTAQMVFAPAVEGEVGIAPRHAPLLTMIRPGEVRIRDENGAEHHIFVTTGVLEVQPTAVTILADTAVRAADLDEAAAIEAKRRAEELLAKREGDIDFSLVQSELLEAVTKLQMIERLRRNIRH